MIYFDITEEERAQLLTLDKVLTKNALRSEEAFREFSEDQVIEKLQGADNITGGPLTNLAQCVIMLIQEVDSMNSRLCSAEMTAQALKDKLKTFAKLYQEEQLELHAARNDYQRNSDLSQLVNDLELYL